MWKYSILVKMRESLPCVTNRCIKVTSNLILPSVCPYYKSRVKFLIFKKFLSNISQLKLSQNDKAPTNIAQTHYPFVRTILCNLLWILYFHQRNY